MTKPVKITSDTVRGLMDTATTSVTNMRKSVQVALLGLVEHASEHGDKRMLLNDAPDWIKSMHGTNMAAIVEWCVKFGGVNVGNNGFVNDRERVADLQGAMACDWWTLKPPQVFKGMDLTTDLGKLIAKVKTCNDTAEQSGEQHLVFAPDDAVAAITTLHAKLVSDKDKAERKAALAKLQAEVDNDELECETPTENATLDDLSDLEANPGETKAA